MSKWIEPKDNLSELLQIKNATETEADLYFYGDIVSSWWGAWDNTDQYPDNVKRFLDGAKGKKLNIHVNSGGGSVFAGIAIYNMIKNHDAETVTYIDGMAASIASVIALASNRVVMRTGSTLMVHKPLYSLWGCYNADDFRKMAKDLDAVQACIMQVYKENMTEGVDIKVVENLVNAETYMTSDEAVKYFNIEIEETLQAVACQSEYMEKFLNVPNTFKNKQLEIEKAKAQLELLKLKEVIK